MNIHFLVSYAHIWGFLRDMYLGVEQHKDVHFQFYWVLPNHSTSIWTNFHSLQHHMRILFPGIFSFTWYCLPFHFCPPDVREMIASCFKLHFPESEGILPCCLTLKMHSFLSKIFFPHCCPVFTHFPQYFPCVAVPAVVTLHSSASWSVCLSHCPENLQDNSYITLILSRSWLKLSECVWNLNAY